MLEEEEGVGPGPRAARGVGLALERERVGVGDGAFEPSDGERVPGTCRAPCGSPTLGAAGGLVGAGIGIAGGIVGMMASAKRARINGLLRRLET